jgi:serine/threonine protein phosphatase PrpC
MTAGAERGAEDRLAFDVGLATHTGRVRTGNEDSVLCEPLESAHVSERGLFCAVADGMGGHADGEEASSTAVRVARDAYYAARDLDSKAALSLAVAQSNAAVYEAGAGTTGRDHMGTTLTAAVIFGDRVVVGHVGDSRAYLIHDVAIRQITRDHSWVAEEVEAGRMTPEQARVNPRRNIITRALGLRPDVEVDTHDLDFAPGDAIVLCSDGLYGLMTDGEIIDSVQRLPEADAVDALVGLANERGGPDNVSVVVVRVAWTDDPAVPRAPSSSLIGTRLGPYSIVGLLGRGGMGAVYRGVHPTLQVPRAIKVLSARLQADGGFVERFVREARIGAYLSHPNIVRIFDVGEEHGHHFLVMELLEGQSLSELLRTGRALPLTSVNAIVLQLADAIDYALTRGATHRDLKPSNVFVGPDDHVTLLDFGIAQRIDGVAMDGVGTPIGTPQYMAPELFNGAMPDARSDIYSMGVLVYRMLTGRLPFEGDARSVRDQRLRDDPPPITTAGRLVPPGVEPIVRKALAKSPADRHDSASDFAAELSAVLQRAIAVEEARAALATDDLGTAEQLARTVLAGAPDDVLAGYIDREVRRRERRREQIRMPASE